MMTDSFRTNTLCRLMQFPLKPGAITIGRSAAIEMHNFQGFELGPLDNQGS